MKKATQSGTNEDHASSSRRGDRVDKVYRASKACDRCRFRRIKCDGGQPCRMCATMDRVCIYAVQRRRDVRNWYCDMQDAVDETIQKLYQACKASNSFPGTLPEERNGPPTTEEILNAMGLSMDPPRDENARESISPSAHSDRLTTLPRGQHDGSTVKHSNEAYTERQSPPNISSKVFGHPPTNINATPRLVWPISGPSHTQLAANASVNLNGTTSRSAQNSKAIPVFNTFPANAAPWPIATQNVYANTFFDDTTSHDHDYNYGQQPVQRPFDTLHYVPNDSNQEAGLGFDPQT